MLYTCRSEEETIALGRRIGAQLKAGSVLCFFGDLGAGKTTLIKGIAAGVSGCDPDEVNSPTFVYLNIYEGNLPVYHFDLYRLHGIEEFLSMGFDEYFSAGGICCVEWSERISQLLPDDFIEVRLEHCGEQIRDVAISPWRGE
ncbi:MAG: tRNA (adenosine(37)-N6)-threonylcarbamoyltransferase complex ATPase subunit type 1 TsaE [Chlamydiia bacterium]|nr:tRNA (adenosine(37)-N6)-threonylcarbamoyltransferase complex ATPase subunit type 1 TsaE [Chlamydiia bacterium]